MNYTQSVGEKSTVKLTINFTNEEWKSANESAYKTERARYTVPGFRKGKAPKAVLENFYGKGVFFEEALNILYRDNYFTIIEKEKDNFTVVGEPSLDVEKITDDEGIILTAVVPVKPDVELECYTGLKIKKYEYNVTDEDVDKEIEKMAEKDSTLVEVTRPAQNGDTANIDFSGSVDGEKFAGGTAEDFDLVLGSGSFIPGFEEQIVGMNVGEEKDLNVKFPEEYQAEDLRGKDAVFAVKLNKLSEKKLPELNDEYVKSHFGSENLEALKEKTKERLSKQASDRGRDQTENSIIEELCKHAKVELPDAMIESEIDRIVNDFSYRLSYQGIKLEEYLQYLNQTMEQFRSQFAEQGKSRALSQLVIDKIIKNENIKADDVEVDEKIAEQAKSVEKTVEEYKKSIDPRQVEYITNDIIITKLFDFLSKNNELYIEENK